MVRFALFLLFLSMNLSTPPRENITSITVLAGEWFDKVNGNSYFAGKILVNGEAMYYMPFQYGYGSHFETVAEQTLQKAGVIPVDATSRKNSANGIWVKFFIHLEFPSPSLDTLFRHVIRVLELGCKSH